MKPEFKQTIRDCINQGKAIIQSNASIDTDWLDATLLFSFASGINRNQILANLNLPIVEVIPRWSETEYQRFIDYCHQRASGKPVAYIIGRKEFFGRDYTVNESVLIPRPDTEILVEWVIEDWHSATPKPQLIDCCTGSGCIAISLALELQLPVIASDISADALVIALQNAGELAGQGQIEFLQTDLLANIDRPDESVDVICSNPPYVPRQESLEKLAMGWGEPLLALDGGDDGLNIIRRLAAQAFQLLKPHGCFYMEFGDRQRTQIEQILLAAGFTQIEFRQDLSGLDRIVRASRKGYYVS